MTAVPLSLVGPDVQISRPSGSEGGARLNPLFLPLSGGFPRQNENRWKFGTQEVGMSSKTVCRHNTPGSVHCIQTVADGEGQFERMIGLLEVIEAAAQDEVLAHHVSTIATGKNHFELGPVGP